MTFLWTILGLFLLWLWLRGHWFAAVLTPIPTFYIAALIDAAFWPAGAVHPASGIAILAVIEAVLLIPAIVRYAVLPKRRSRRMPPARQTVFEGGGVDD